MNKSGMRDSITLLVVQRIPGGSVHSDDRDDRGTGTNKSGTTAVKSTTAVCMAPISSRVGRWERPLMVRARRLF